MITLIQQLNPIKSQIWLKCDGYYNNFGTYSAYNYGRSDRIFTVQVGDGVSGSTFPTPSTPNGFEFTDLTYLYPNATLGIAWSVSFILNYNGFLDEYIIGFSTGGGIILNDSSASNCLSYYDGTTRISSGKSLIKNKPYNVTITKSAANLVKLYVDGYMSGSGTGTVGNTILSYIGCSNSKTNYFHGILYDFATYKYEINQSQVNNVRNRESRDLIISIPTPTIASSVDRYDGFYFDASDSNKLTLNTAPTASDLNMENVGIAPWDTTTATVTKETSSPHSGNRNLKVVSSAGYGLSFNPITAIAGNRYKLEGWVRGAGLTTSSAAYCLDANNVRNISSSSNWQPFSVDDVESAVTRIWIGCNPAKLNDYTEWDDLSISNLSINAWAPTAVGNSLAGLTLTQGTAANMPWKSTTLINNKQVVQIADDGLVSSLSASYWRFLHYNAITLYPKFSIISVLNIPSVLQAQYILSNANASRGIQVFAYTDNKIHFVVYNDLIQVIANTLSSVFVPGQTLIMTSVSDGVNLKLRINGVETSSAYSGTPATNGDAATTLKFFSHPTNFANSLNGFIGEICAFSNTLTTNEINSIERSLAAKWGITLS